MLRRKGLLAWLRIVKCATLVTQEISVITGQKKRLLAAYNFIVVAKILGDSKRIIDRIF